MTDIFDEVDEILSDVDTMVEEPVAVEADSNFNESELQDIMAEIESLEKDFEVEALTVVAQKTERPDLQAEIERELSMSQDISEEVKDDVITHAEVESAERPQAIEEPKILSFEKKVDPKVTPLAPIKSSASEISFSAQGQMNLSLSFKVGEETASLSVDPLLGLVVTMKGVELYISETGGCKVTMENGVNFTIPLTSPNSASKKKSA